jgi:hypothetical protein
MRQLQCAFAMVYVTGTTKTHRSTPKTTRRRNNTPPKKQQQINSTKTQPIYVIKLRPKL